MSGLPEGLSKDVTLANGPEDSISDLSWSSAGNYLAVASWDSKVRIYDISQTASGEGKALMQFDAPVLSCCWSKVSFVMRRFCGVDATFSIDRERQHNRYNSHSFYRMDKKSLALEQTRLPASWISRPTVPLPSRWPRTTRPSARCASSRPPILTPR